MINISFDPAAEDGEVMVITSYDADGNIVEQDSFNPYDNDETRADREMRETLENDND
jgi:hypothetical protein